MFGLEDKVKFLFFFMKNCYVQVTQKYQLVYWTSESVNLLAKSFKHVLKKFILVCNEMFIKQFLNNNTKAKMAINFKHQNYATCPTRGLTGGDIKIGKTII